MASSKDSSDVSPNNIIEHVGVCDPTAHHGVAHMMLLGRTTSLIVTRWYVRRNISIACRFIQVQLDLNCVTP
jgi:hypothetical protein